MQSWIWLEWLLDPCVFPVASEASFCVTTAGLTAAHFVVLDDFAIDLALFPVVVCRTSQVEEKHIHTHLLKGPL